MSEYQAGYDVGVISIESHEQAAAASQTQPRVCPFCASPRVYPTTIPGYCWIYCDGCAAGGPIAETLEAAIVAWNRRA